jgi:hypothetical protein
VCRHHDQEQDEVMRTPVDPSKHDPVIVARLVAGEHHPGRVNDSDAHEAVRQLVALGFSDGQIAYRVPRRVRSVLRIRARMGLPAALPPGSNQNAWRVQEPSVHWRSA